MANNCEVHEKKISVYASSDHKDFLSPLASASGVGVLFKMRRFIASAAAMCTSDSVGASHGACGYMFWPDSEKRNTELSSWAMRKCPSELSAPACDVYMRGNLHGIVSGLWENVLFVGASVLLIGCFHGLIICSAHRVRTLLTWLVASATVGILL
jgi:hypothetical protein